MDPVSIAFASLSLGSGVLIWTIRQEGRISAHDQLFAEREKQAAERYQALHADLKEVKTDLKQILKGTKPNGAA